MRRSLILAAVVLMLGGVGGFLVVGRALAGDAEPPGKPAAPKKPAAPTLIVGTGVVPQGLYAEVPVQLYAGAGSAIAAATFEVAYDPSVVRPAGPPVERGIGPDGLLEASVHEEGKVRIAFALAAGLRDSAHLTVLHLIPVGPPGSRTPLRVRVISAVNAAGASTALGTVDGQVTVASGAVSPPGDADGDGALTARDAAEVLRMAVGLVPAVPACDIDGDGQVTSTDAWMILAKAAGSR